jgi:hypothetical protein
MGRVQAPPCSLASAEILRQKADARGRAECIVYLRRNLKVGERGHQERARVSHRILQRPDNRLRVAHTRRLEGRMHQEQVAITDTEIA